MVWGMRHTHSKGSPLQCRKIRHRKLLLHQGKHLLTFESLPKECTPPLNISLQIYQFRMRCHLCPNYIIIKTDPENRDYTIVSGAKRKTETYSAEDAETIQLDVKEEEKGGDDQVGDDPLKKLEKNVVNKQKAQSEVGRLKELIAISADVAEDDFASNQLLRGVFRTKKREFEREREDRFKKNVYFPLLQETEEEKEKDKDEFRSKNMMIQSRSKPSRCENLPCPSLARLTSPTFTLFSHVVNFTNLSLFLFLSLSARPLFSPSPTMPPLASSINPLHTKLMGKGSKPTT